MRVYNKQQVLSIVPLDGGARCGEIKANQVKTALLLSCATTALTMSLFMGGAAQAQSR